MANHTRITDRYLDENAVVIHDATLQRWLLFRKPITIHTAHSVEEVVPVLNAVEKHVSDGQVYAVGFVAYEAAPGFDPALVVQPCDDFPLAWFGIYLKPEEFAFPGSMESPPAELTWESSVSEHEYQGAIQRIRQYIGAGDTYQVNYSFRLRAPLCGDSWELFVQMVRAQGAGYGAFLKTEDWIVCCGSPELYLRLHGRELSCQPMKGTISRGLWYADDREKAAWLQASEKNRAENTMIVDMVRNDLGKIAEFGSVEVMSLFDLEQYPTLWQLTSTVRCLTKASLAEIFRATFPPASITGAPKVRTMEIIAELEGSPRRIYTGTIGLVTPERNAQFNVAIRTVLVDRRNKMAEYGVGGGIVWDSTEQSELEECRTKATILTQPVPDFSLFESILWTPEGGYFLLDRHLRRLADSAAYFSYPVDLEAVRWQLKVLAGQLSSVPHKIRLLVSREGEAVLESQPLTRLARRYRVGLSRSPIDSSNPFLYHKTTCRGVYEQAMQASPGYDDVLLWNQQGEVTESCVANVVVKMDGELLTPPVQCGLLAGTYCSLLLEQGKIKERIIKVEELERCSKLYLINSVRKFWRVVLLCDSRG